MHLTRHCLIAPKPRVRLFCCGGVESPIFRTVVLDAPKYPNYAITGTPLEEMYGANVPKLRALKILVDPTNVMGLAGGWKF